MVCAHGDQAPTGWVKVQIRKPATAYRAQRLRYATVQRLAVYLLIRVVDEIHRVITYHERAAAVLVHAAAHAEGCGREIARCFTRLRAHQDAAAAFRRPAFQPIHAITGDARLRKAYAACGNLRGA